MRILAIGCSSASSSSGRLSALGPVSSSRRSSGRLRRLGLPGTSVLRAWDAQAVWHSYSSDYQALLLEEGGGEAETVRLYAELRKQGASIDEVDYIGGYQAKQTGYFLYVTRHFVANQDPMEVVGIFRTERRWTDRQYRLRRAKR